MGVEKMSVSFDLDLGEAIRTAAEEESVTVSAWLAEAARARLRNKYLGEFLAAWQEKYGEFTEEELEEARADFAKARRLARGKGAHRGARP